MRPLVMIAPESLGVARAMVIAPHPDDESLGCGGLIAALAARGCHFHIVFVTDGGASHANSPTWPRSRLVAQRESEAVEALDRLGAGDQPRSFLRLPDSDMPAPAAAAGQAALEQLRAIAGQLCPELVLLPWRRDPHRDHRDAWRLATTALEPSGRRPMTLEYAVWLAELGTPADQPRRGEAQPIRFDISAVVARKRAAVAAHVSQTTDLIADDPQGFRLQPDTVSRLTGPCESYWRCPT